MNKKKINLGLGLVLLISIHSAWASIHPPVTEPIPIKQLQNYNDYSPSVKNVIEEAQDLTKQHLTYLYGSADPANKGMDCSGVVYYLLKQLNINNPPRQASTLYLWALKEGKMYVPHSDNFNSRDFSKLKPGDLIFWTGTYPIHTYPPITHVNIYLGKDNHNNPLMFGSSDGRPYQGKEMWGVSVFDFILPSKNSPIKIAGYSCIPAITCGVQNQNYRHKSLLSYLKQLT
jgi:hypothetical protein